MRLLITGKTRSGKSTSLHLFLAVALQRPWQQILLLDGKGVELSYYAKLATPQNSPLAHYGPNELAQWEAALGKIATGLESRFQALSAHGRRAAAPEDPRQLIIIDEVQIGCRHAKHGKGIKQYLTHIAEQSAALGDVLVLTCQREQNSVPPAVRWNCNAKLRMLGVGFFHYQPDGRPHIAGRLPYITPEEVIDRLNVPPANATDLTVTVDSLLTLLRANYSGRRHGQDATDGQSVAHNAEHARANATLYLGDDGSGKSWRLHNHPCRSTKRQVYVDLQDPHKAWLAAIMDQCGAGIPPRASVQQLREMAILAICAEPTTLLLDNLDSASHKARESIQALVNAAHIVALAARVPDTPALERKVKPFIARCKVVRIPPLTTAEAQALADQQLPADIPRRSATCKRIVDMGQGHPATIVSLCRQAKEGTLPELRHLENAPKRFNMIWLLLVPVLLLLFIWRYRIDSYMLSALIMVALMISRPFLYRSLRRR